MRLAYLLVLLCLCHAANAQSTRYISDQLEVPMRTGTTTGHRIIRMVTSGTEVQVLSQDTASGYSRIRLGGREGWMLTRYLMNDPVPRERLRQAEAAVEPLREEAENLRAQLETATRRTTALEGELNQLKTDHGELNSAYQELNTLTAKEQAINARNERLESEVIQLERQVTVLEQENQSLNDDNRRAWFVRGAGVLMLGLLLGVILPRMRPSRSRSRWGEL